MAGWLTDFDKILPRQLDGSLDCFRPAGDIVDPVDAFRRGLNQRVRQLLGRFAGKETGMGKGNLVHLRPDRFFDGRFTMAEARDSSTTRAIEITLAGTVDQVAAISRYSDRRRVLGMTRKDV